MAEATKFRMESSILTQRDQDALEQAIAVMDQAAFVFDDVKEYVEKNKGPGPGDELDLENIQCDLYDAAVRLRISLTLYRRDHPPSKVPH